MIPFITGQHLGKVFLELPLLFLLAITRVRIGIYYGKFLVRWCYHSILRLPRHVLRVVEGERG